MATHTRDSWPNHSWGEAFSTLAKALAATIEVEKIERAVIFLDELPWMAAPKSGLIQALDHSWNTQFSKIPEVIVVVCGSAASWMLDNLIHAKGGLHNRITRQIRLLFRTNGEKYWLEKRRTPAYAAWAGYTFENICLTHVQWIQKALRLDHISFEVGSWCFVPAVGHADRSGAQIDLLFDRDDQVISLCEIKYNAESFSIDKSYARELKRKIETFQSVTRTRKNLQLVLITLNGLKPNIWSEGLVDVSLSAEEIILNES